MPTSNIRPDAVRATAAANKHPAMYARLLESKVMGHALLKPRHTQLWDVGYTHGGRFVTLFNAKDGHPGIPPLTINEASVWREQERNNQVFQSHHAGSIQCSLGAPFPQISGTFEISTKHHEAAFLALGGEIYDVEEDGATAKIEKYLVENQQTIFNAFRDSYTLSPQDIVIVYGTTKVCAWAGGVAYGSSKTVKGSVSINTIGFNVQVAATSQSDQGHTDAGGLAASTPSSSITSDAPTMPQSFSLGTLSWGTTCGPAGNIDPNVRDRCVVIKPIVATRRKGVQRAISKVAHAATSKFRWPQKFLRQRSPSPPPTPAADPCISLAADGTPFSTSSLTSDEPESDDELDSAESDALRTTEEREGGIHNVLASILERHPELDIVSGDASLLDAHPDQCHVEIWTTSSGETAGRVRKSENPIRSTVQAATVASTNIQVFESACETPSQSPWGPTRPCLGETPFQDIGYMPYCSPPTFLPLHSPGWTPIAPVPTSARNCYRHYDLEVGPMKAEWSKTDDYAMHRSVGAQSRTRRPAMCPSYPHSPRLVSPHRSVLHLFSWGPPHGDSVLRNDMSGGRISTGEQRLGGSSAQATRSNLMSFLATAILSADVQIMSAPELSMCQRLLGATSASLALASVVINEYRVWRLRQRHEVINELHGPFRSADIPLLTLACATIPLAATAIWMLASHGWRTADFTASLPDQRWFAATIVTGCIAIFAARAWLTITYRKNKVAPLPTQARQSHD